MKLLDFSKREIESLIRRELKVQKRIKSAFEYTFGKLKELGQYVDITNLKDYNLENQNWNEGKSYYWLSVEHGTTQFLLRRYDTHFTIFYKTVTRHEDLDWNEKRFGCFTYDSKSELNTEIESEDAYCDNSFLDLNKSFPQMVERIKAERAFTLWSMDHPKWVEVKTIYDGDDTIDNLELFAYCVEELSNIETELFAQNEMMERLKTIKVGDMLSAYKVTKVKPTTKDEYYHDAGIEMQNTNFPDSKPKWSDVYSLTQFYFEYLFPNS